MTYTYNIPFKNKPLLMIESKINQKNQASNRSKTQEKREKYKKSTNLKNKIRRTRKQTEN